VFRMTKIARPLRRVGPGVFLALGFTIQVHAQGAGDSDSGLKLARAWCSNCHVVEDAGPATSTGAPPFAAIARKSAVTPMSLRVFFQSPHQRMPDLHLSNSEMDDLTAYILSLRGL
jgi:mono/diheme cytochrome c family protein